MVTIRIKTDNAAFADASAVEVARILRELATRLEHDHLLTRGVISLRDGNGNTVGECKVTR